jgi:hypothetical protein
MFSKKTHPFQGGEKDRPAAKWKKDAETHRLAKQNMRGTTERARNKKEHARNILLRTKTPATKTSTHNPTNLVLRALHLRLFKVANRRQRGRSDRRRNCGGEDEAGAERPDEINHVRGGGNVAAKHAVGLKKR